MKRIVFLIIATLLVLGLVLPGCTGGGFVRTRPIVAGQINIAVTGPMGDVQGIHHMLGATMAKDEINALPNKIYINGTAHTVVLHQVNTNEIQGQPSEGVLALRAEIEKVDFVVGGFRTESVSAYRLEAMDDKVIFMNCGAATKALQESVDSNYGVYKYWFKATPYNEVFLCTSMLKLTANVVANLVGKLVAYNRIYGKPYWDPAYNITGSGTWDDPFVARIAIFGEALSWDAGIVSLAQERLPRLVMPSKNITLNITGTWLVSDKATNIATEMAQIAATKPHLIFTIFSGPVGKVYSKARADMALPAMSVGINVEGQLQSMVAYTSGGCLYDTMLDTWGWGVNQTDLTAPFLTKFMSSNYSNGEYPLYTAATYDAIYALKAAVENTSSMDPDVLVAWLENKANAQKGTGTPATAYYPYPLTTINSTAWAMNETQVLSFYPWLSGLMIWNNSTVGPELWAYNQSLWSSVTGLVSHDTAYGPGYQTGLGTQWQNITGTLRKVGWWPALNPGLEFANGWNPLQLQAAAGCATVAGLWYKGVIDQYGLWNFIYPGTRNITIPTQWWLNLS